MGTNERQSDWLVSVGDQPAGCTHIRILIPTYPCPHAGAGCTHTAHCHCRGAGSGCLNRDGYYEVLTNFSRSSYSAFLEPVLGSA